MTFLDMCHRDGGSSQQNIQNTRLFVQAPQLCHRHLADRRSLHHGGRIYTHRHTHTHYTLTLLLPVNSKVAITEFESD